jgi:hypothetical protein
MVSHNATEHFNTNTPRKRLVSPAVSSEKECKNSNQVVLHQNICSIRQKPTELEVLLCSELKHVDVMCLIEH